MNLDEYLNHLKSKKTAKKVTARQFADLLGITEQHLSALRTGRYRFSKMIVNRLQNMCGGILDEDEMLNNTAWKKYWRVNE